MEATVQNIIAEQGSVLSVSLTGAAGVITGRNLLMHVRSSIGVVTIKIVASTDNGELVITGSRSAQLTISSDVMSAVSVTNKVEFWGYDVESYTDATDIRREWAGSFKISRDFTRSSEPDVEESLAGVVRYDTPQVLTSAQQNQSWDNIGGDEAARDAIGAALVAGSNVTITVSDAGDTITIASTGGGGSSAWGGITGTLSDQTDLQSALDLKAPLASPTLTGTPAAPTAAGGTNTTQLSTTAFVGGEIATHAAATDPHGDRAYADGLAGNYATAAQGALADSATQPGDLATVATTGAYADLSGTPTLGTAAALDVPASGNAASGEVVKGSDTRLTDARTPTAHTHPAADISDSTTAGRALITAADAAAQRTALGLGTAATTAATDYATAAQGTDDRTASGIRETSGPTLLTIGAIADGEFIKRVGSTAVGATPSGGLTGFTAAENTTSPNATVPVASLTANNAATNVDVAIIPKGSGALIAAMPDSTATGGNKRGPNSVDWQTSRALAMQAATGIGAVISGGQNNRASANYGTVVGGSGNTAAGGGWSVTGGRDNNCSSVYGVTFGFSNASTGDVSTVSGGASNTSAGSYSWIPGGYRATVRGLWGAYAWASEYRTTVGDNQHWGQVASATTTDAATTVTLTASRAAVSTNNVAVLPNNCAMSGIWVIQARDSSGNAATWVKAFRATRGANAASTAVAFSTDVVTPNIDAALSTVTATIAADTTRGGPVVQVTGVAATTIDWICEPFSLQTVR